MPKTYVRSTIEPDVRRLAAEVIQQFDIKLRAMKKSEKVAAKLGQPSVTLHIASNPCLNEEVAELIGQILKDELDESGVHYTVGGSPDGISFTFYRRLVTRPLAP